jgi:parallel beta-helix repeat protein
MKLSIKTLFLIYLVVTFGLSSISTAGVYWISPEGSVLGTGSSENPFRSINIALEKVGGGNSFIFKPGYYTGQITILPKYSGTPQNPTILKSQYKYKARLNGSSGHIIYAREGCNWVVIDGFDISGAWGTGVKFGGDYCVVRNSRIHNNSLQGIEAHHRNNIVIENNLIEYNGKSPQFDHGIYANGSKLVIRNNIVRFNSCIGIQLSSYVSDSIIENNLVHANRKAGIYINSDPNKSPNRIVNNTIVGNRHGIWFISCAADIVANNIIIYEYDILPPIYGFGGLDISKLIIKNNLFKPFDEKLGDSNFTGNPLFLDEKKGLFYIKQNSPVIGKGSVQYAPKKDFFGKFRNVGTSVDLGCYSYDPILLTPKVTEDLYLGWAYHSLGNEIPDLWKFPDEK